MSMDRMAGSVPIWKAPPPKLNETPAQKLENLAASQRTYTNERMAGTMQGAEMDFSDVMDVVNPLHHIPVVSSVYRNMTGDEISATARIVGGTIYGGPIGAASSLANAIVSEHSGRDLSEHAMAVLNPNANNALSIHTPEPEMRMAGSVREAAPKPVAIPEPSLTVDMQIAMLDLDLAPMKPVTRMSFNS